MTDEEILKTFDVKVVDNNIYGKFFKNISDRKANVRVAELFCNQIYNILNQHKERKYNLIMDLLDLGNQGTSTRKARETYAKIMEHSEIEKVAVVGGSVVMKTIANFIMYLTEKKEYFRFFESKEDALKWINYSNGKSN